MWRQEIENYIPVNEQEEKDKQLILTCIQTFDDVLTRNNEVCHMTVSSFVVNEAKTHVLMAYHNLYNSWAWLGGHADGDHNFAHVAKKELFEETGVQHAKLLSDSIFSLEVLNVLSHIKKGTFVSSHLHLNVTYVFEASMDEKLTIAEQENSNVGWLPIDELHTHCSEEFMLPIYYKIADKIKRSFA